MRQRFPLIALLLASTLLGACGTRGPLTLPPPQSKTAASANAGAPSISPLLTSTDLNTAKERS